MLNGQKLFTASKFNALDCREGDTVRVALVACSSPIESARVAWIKHYSCGTAVAIDEPNGQRWVLGLPRTAHRAASDFRELSLIEPSAWRVAELTVVTKRDWTSHLRPMAWHRVEYTDGRRSWRFVTSIKSRTDCFVRANNSGSVRLMRFPEPGIASVSGPISKPATALSAAAIHALRPGTHVSASYRKHFGGLLEHADGELVMTKWQTPPCGEDAREWEGILTIVVKTGEGTCAAFNVTPLDPPDEFVELRGGLSAQMRTAICSALVAAGVHRRHQPSVAAALEVLERAFPQGLTSSAIAQADGACLREFEAHVQSATDAEIEALLAIAAKP